MSSFSRASFHPFLIHSMRSSCLFAPLVALVLGQIATGFLADFAARRDMRAYMWIAAGGCLIAVPCGLLFTLYPDQWIAIAGFGLLSFFIGPHHMCAVVVGQTLSPPRMRATASMVIGLASAVASMGIGPLFVGVLNDIFNDAMGPLGIRASLSVALLFLVLASIAALAAARHVRTDYEHMRRQAEPLAG
ncbi:MAG: hypothetical protein EOP18_04395 [Rhizobiaceae bacterium]|nr:MAG: hypothetical protein EOP18_04395 [Rhizobiaceae bacterium]